MNLNTSSRTRRPFLKGALSLLFLLLLLIPAGPAKATSSEYEEFGKHIASAIVSVDAQAFEKAIDKEALLDRVFKGMNQDEKTIRELRAGILSGFPQIAQTMVSQVSGTSKIKFIRSRDIDGKPHALIRVDFGDQGLNYLDFVLDKNSEGAVRLIDWYDYVKGQYYTDSVRQLIALALPEEKGLVQSLLGVNKLETEEAKLFVRHARLIQEQKFSQWLEEYKNLPKQMQDSRIMLITRVMLASAIDDNTEYLLASKDLNTKVGDDPTLGLLLLDYYFLSEDYEAAHKALGNLNKYTGGDAAIDDLQAKIYLTQKKYSKSMSYAKKAASKDAEFESAYWTYLDSSVYAKKYGKAVETLKTLEKDFGYDIVPEELAKVEGYGGFAVSDEFKEWSKSK